MTQKCLGVLPEETIFAIFEKYRIFPNRQFLTPLMDTLELRKSGNVNYRGLLNLLNWRRNLPALPEIKRESIATIALIITFFLLK